MDISLEEYSVYYFLLKRLAELHKKFAFGATPDIPSGFSENLCRHLLQLKKPKGRTVDAVDASGLEIEIKATGSSTGQTTISSCAKFDILIWINIDFQNDCAYIYKIPYTCFSISGEKGRKSIAIGGIARKNSIDPFVYCFHKKMIIPKP
jgi:hypothetical protein